MSKIPERFELCLQQNGKQIGHLLYKLNAPAVASKDITKCEIADAIPTSEDVVKSFVPDCSQNYDPSEVIEYQFHEKGCVFIMEERKFKYIGCCTISLMKLLDEHSINIRMAKTNIVIKSSTVSADARPRRVKNATLSFLLIGDNCRFDIWLIRFQNNFSAL
jgi:hypothetical protein